MSYGAFVSVRVQNQSLTGLLHVSEMDCFVTDATEHLELGDTVSVRLLQQKKGRVSWSSSRLPRYDLEAFEALKSSGAFVKGLVQSTEPRGALVLVQPPEGGMAVLGVLRQGYAGEAGREVSEVLSEGQEVDVRVVSTAGGRLLLSMQELVPEAFLDIGPEVFLKGVVKVGEPFRPRNLLFEPSFQGFQRPRPLDAFAFRSCATGAPSWRCRRPAAPPTGASCTSAT